MGLGTHPVKRTVTSGPKRRDSHASPEALTKAMAYKGQRETNNSADIIFILGFFSTPLLPLETSEISTFQGEPEPRKHLCLP